MERYDAPDYLNLAQTEDSLGRRCKDRMAVIEPSLPGGRLLDVGAGAGVFLGVARARGYDVSGIDLSARWAAYAREHYGAEVAVGDLSETTLAPQAYDVVTLWHVLEHLPDPLAALHKLREALNPGGRLVAEVPNFGAPSVRLKCRWLAATKHEGPRWRHLNPREHVWHFERHSLRECLSRTGFSIVLLRTMSGDRNAGGGPLGHRLLRQAGWGSRLLCVAEAT